jgi:superfamily II helicase
VTVAHAEHTDETGSSRSWDGSVRCVLCADTERATEHEWCAAAEALVCDSCCNELLNGEPRRILAAAEAESRNVSPLDLVAACADCDRLHRMIAGEVTQLAEAEDEEPGCIH